MSGSPMVRFVEDTIVADGSSGYTLWTPMSSILLIGCSIGPHSATDMSTSSLDSDIEAEAICLDSLDSRFVVVQVDGTYVPSWRTTTNSYYNPVYSDHCAMGTIDRFCSQIAHLSEDDCDTFSSFLAASGWLTEQPTALASGMARRVPASYPDGDLMYDVYVWSEYPDDYTRVSPPSWAYTSTIAFDVDSGAVIGAYRLLSGRDLMEVWCCEGQQVQWTQWGALFRVLLGEPETIYTPADFL
jgi:hypothetical protein